MAKQCPNTGHCPNCDPRAAALKARGALLLAAGCLFAPLSPSQGAITNFAQVSRLSREEAAQGKPVRITGVVLCYDKEWGQLFIHDGDETKYFAPQTFGTALEPGQRIELTARTRLAEGLASLTNPSLKLLEKGPLPSARKRGIHQLTNDLGEWVEIRGRVRVADVSSGRLTLVMEDKGQSGIMFVMGPLVSGFAYKSLVGDRISIRGINTSKVVRGRLEPASLTCPGLEQIKIVETRERDPWQKPVESIDAVLSRELGPWTNEPVHINGVVANYRLPNNLEIKDATGSIQARALHLGGIRLNGRIELWGFLALTPDGPMLRDAFFEVPQPATHKPGDLDAHGSSGLLAPKTLTKVADIVKLNSSETGAHLPVRLRGLITYADPEWHSVFFQDSTGSVYVESTQSDLRSGQFVELQGQTDPGGFAPQVVNGTARILGTTNLPAAARSELEDLATGRLDAHWIELQGIVRRVSVEWGHLMLTLTTSSGRFKVLVPNFATQAAPENFVDALVTVQGACGSDLNTRGQIAGITVYSPSLEYLHVIEAVPADPFSLRAIPIATLSTFNPNHTSGRRVRIDATVTFIEPNGEFFAQDTNGAIRVKPQSAGPAAVKVGDQVQMLGFPQMGEVAPGLEETVFRVAGQQRRPDPRRVLADSIIAHPENEGRLIEVEGELLQRAPRSARPRLVLQQGAMTFTAFINDSAGAERLAKLQAGSLLRVTGVCVMQGGEDHTPVAFRVLVGRATDVKLLRQPSWWTAEHALLVAAGLGVAVAASLVWVRSLRRQVLAQTEVIRQKLEERNQFAASLEREKAELAATQQKLVEASRRAGMADVATSVLHNVGNVLNSINVSADLIARSLKDSKGAGLRKLAGLITENQQDLPGFFGKEGKGKDVPNYLERLAAHLTHEQQAVLGELDLLQRNVNHVKEIVVMQQDYAKSSGMNEPHPVKELLEDALRMNEGALDRHEVEVTREIDSSLPPLNVDKHKFLQVLINLLQNAKYACDESGRADKRVTIRAVNGSGSIKISVIDNGVGIPAENLTRIFNHGFTTRKDGHGFGLHSSAIAAQEMGGRLFAGSDGPGKGATFTLDLPINKQN